MKTAINTKKLGEVLSLEYGKPLNPVDRKENGKYPVYGANGIKTRSDKYYYDKPSIIVGRKGSAGEVTLVEERFWPLDVTYYVTYDETKYDLKYLFLLLKRLNLKNLATGVKPGINRNEVYGIMVEIPSLKEQKRVVKILGDKFETIDNLIQITNQQVSHLEELKKSYLEQAFSGKL